MATTSRLPESDVAQARLTSCTILSRTEETFHFAGYAARRSPKICISIQPLGVCCRGVPLNGFARISKRLWVIAKSSLRTLGKDAGRELFAPLVYVEKQLADGVGGVVVHRRANHAARREGPVAAYDAQVLSYSESRIIRTPPGPSTVSGSDLRSFSPYMNMY